MDSVRADTHRLHARMADLQAARQQRPLHGDELSALSECAFRLAVDGATAPARAVELLQFAIRLDRANPKYHYHMARLAFRLGRFDAAAHWLDKARRLCPTSHRIWIHIGLLQRELNEVHRDNPKFLPDRHLQRWTTIAAEVMKGVDAIDGALADFHPVPVKDAAAPAAVTEAAEAPPKRVLAPATCRWLPVHELVADELLQREPGERKRDELREPLQRAAAAAATRPGGAAAFVILAVQWLLRGYSADFVRQVRPGSMGGNGAAAALLDAVLELLDVGPAALPEHLARALSDGRVPPLLAAAIHRLFVLGPQAATGDLAMHLRGAREWLRNPAQDDKAAEELAGSLEQDAKVLEPRPRVRIAGFPPERAEDPAPAEVVARLQRQVAEAEARMEASRAWILERKGRKDFTEEEAIEANRIRRFVRSIKDRAAKAIAALAAAREEGSVTSVEEVQAIAALERRWQDLGTKPGPLAALLKAYPEVALPPEEEAPEPQGESLSPAAQLESWERETARIREEVLAQRAALMEALRAGADEPAAQEVVERTRRMLVHVESRLNDIAAKTKQFCDAGTLPASLEDAVGRTMEGVQNLQPLLGTVRRNLPRPRTSVSPPDTAVPAQEKGAAPPEPLTPRERLRTMAADVESRLRAHFERGEATFGAYTPSQRRLPGLQAVRLSVTARKAEALYHAGLRGEARRAWSAILAEDALDLQVLRNIAVCDSRSHDLQRTLDSWRAYAEVLYFHALSAGDPARMAGPREELHRTFGAAYLPRSSYEEKEISPRASDEAFAFFTSPSRVRGAMRHQILGLMNRRLTLKTAPFFVGVARGEGEAARQAAWKQVEAWVTGLCAALPRRVGVRFGSLVSTRLSEAMKQLEAPQKSSELAATPSYETDKQQLTQWIGDVIQFKFRLCRMLHLFPASASREHLATLADLCAADDVPIGTSQELLTLAALKWHYPAPFLCALVTRGLTVPLMRGAFATWSEDEPRDVPVRAALYQRLVAIHELLDEKAREPLDSPGVYFDIYPPQVREALRGDRDAAAGAAAHLAALQERYPRSAGIACDYASLLAIAGRTPEASEVLAHALQTALSEKGRNRCTALAESLAVGTSVHVVPNG